MRMKRGFMTPPEGEKPEIANSAESNQNMTRVEKEWNLGPELASEMPGANGEYWSKMAEIWDLDEDEARRRVCGNCEYGKNSPRYMKAMDSIPFSKFDADGGGRVYCEKFDFVCHNLRTCQAWEDGESDD